MNIEEWKKLLKHQKTETLQARLKDELESIKFLESIYETGGNNSYFSKEFKKAALREREEICQLTSAIHSLIRERGGEQ